MAVNVERLYPLRHAKARRRDLFRYLKTDRSRYLLGLMVLLCLMSMITLGQTGVVATKGYAIVTLESHRTELLRERSSLQLRYATAQSLERIRERAAQIGLRPMTTEQVRYVVIEQESAAGAGAAPSVPAATPTPEQPGPGSDAATVADP